MMVIRNFPGPRHSVLYRTATLSLEDEPNAARPQLTATVIYFHSFPPDSPKQIHST